MKLYPKPYKFNDSDKCWIFKGDVTIKYNEEFPHEKTLPLLKEFWHNFTNATSNVEFVKDSELPAHTFSVNGVTTALEEGFEHSITVTENGFSVAADGWVGLVHAMFTILQLIQPERIDNEDMDKYHMSCCEISDKPSMNFRCFHYSYGVKPLKTLQKIIRMCALMKYSHILVEFFGTIKFDCLKELAFADTENERKSYTKDELRPYFEEGIALGVEFVPMFNHFGHVSIGSNPKGEHVVLEQNPKLAPLFELDGWCFCMSNPQTKKLLRQVREEMIELCGDGSYVHIGGDEAHSFGTCDECRKTPIEKLYADYINEVANEMKEKGRRVIIWGDTMLEHGRWRYHTDSFGHPFEASEGTAYDAHKALDMLDRSVIINDWQYKIWDDNVITSEYLTQKGFDVIPASASEVKNTDALCKAVRKHNYFGFMQTEWDSQPLVFNLITRGGTSSWMENIDEIDKLERGEHNFVREYMLMNHRAGSLSRNL